MINGTGAVPDFNRASRYAWGAGIIGSLACLAGVVVNPREFLHAYLWAYWFWLGLAIGCGQMLMLYHLVGGAWGYVLQRVFEAAIATFPVMFALVLPLVFGMNHIYPYADPARIAADKALAHKLPYLNTPFILVRLAIYFLIWGVTAYYLVRWSRLQDETEDYGYVRLRIRISGPGMIFWSLAVSFMAVDWFMSLEPDFFSSMYPGFYLVGEALTGMAFGIIVLRYLAMYSPVAEIISPEDFHDQGNLLFTLVVLWAYVQLAQLIITWSGNQPKEISWYLDRTRGEWSYVALFLALFHFFFPFFALLSRRAKLQRHRLAFLAVVVIVVHAVDNYWNTEPAFHPFQIYFHWLDVAAPVALGGVWVGLFLWQLKKRPLLPLNDPREVEALEKI